MPRQKDIPIAMLDELDSFAAKSGEHLLWFNVLDRALQDYTRFFDWYIQRASKSNGVANPDVTRESLRGLMSYELEVLKWFFFSAQPTPFNLSWIFDHCFGGDERLLTSIRDRIKLKHRTNLIENKNHPAVAHFVSQYTENGLLENVPTDVPSRKIRWHVSSLT